MYVIFFKKFGCMLQMFHLYLWSALGSIKILLSITFSVLFFKFPSQTNVHSCVHLSEHPKIETITFIWNSYTPLFHKI